MSEGLSLGHVPNATAARGSGHGSGGSGDACRRSGAESP